MIKYIESKDNNKIKHAASLKESKYRKEYGEFLSEGKKALELALISKNVKEIYTIKELENIPSDITQYVLKPDLLKKISSSVNPEGIVFVSQILERKPKRLNKVVYLDHINDPGNLGTIIRTALAFSYDAVIVSEGSCDPYNEKAVAASKGSLFLMPILRGDLDTFSEGKKVIVSALREDAIDEKVLDVKDPFVLVLGNEANGVSKDVLNKADIVVKIGIQNIDSLNVSIAAGILMNRLK